MKEEGDPGVRSQEEHGSGDCRHPYQGSICGSRSLVDGQRGVKRMVRLAKRSRATEARNPVIPLEYLLLPMCLLSKVGSGEFHGFCLFT